MIVYLNNPVGMHFNKNGGAQQGVVVVAKLDLQHGVVVVATLELQSRTVIEKYSFEAQPVARRAQTGWIVYKMCFLFVSSANWLPL